MDMKVIVNNNIKWINRDDYSYIYNFYTDQYYKLEDLSKEIWTLITEGPIEFKTIIKTFTNSDLNESRLSEEEISSFLEQLKDERMISFY